MHRSIALNPIAQRGVSHFRSHRLPGIPVIAFGSVIVFNELPSTDDANIILLPLFIESVFTGEFQLYNGGSPEFMV